ncbi:MAG: CotH kinase family protein [Chitinophagales bacterium]
MPNVYFRLFFGLLFFLISIPSIAQQVKFNEVVSSNSTYLDEDGDSPDWFELHNFENESISLEGWTVTDDIEQADKWTFPNNILDANGYMLVWASGKDRYVVETPRTLITHGDVFRYIIPNQNINQWTQVGFVDLQWQQGATSLGYGDDDDATLLPLGTRSVFLRKNFTLSDVDAIQTLILDMDYDDSFVAYINGFEVARANINGIPPAYDATSNIDREATIYQDGLPERFTIENPQGLLRLGENVLSVQVHNVSSTSSDLSIIPFLSATYTQPTTEGIVPPDLLSLKANNLHANFKVSSNSETLYLFNPDQVLIDSIQIENLPPDVSLGIPNGGETLTYFAPPSPGLPNPANGFMGVSDATIEFSHPGGVTNPVLLSMSGVESPAVIRYTLDSTIPTETSPIYNSAIQIPSITVVRARVFEENYIPSKTQTRTYVVNQSHDLPVICLVTEPHNFFDSDEGIYVLGDGYVGPEPYYGSNIWQDWERPIHFTLYEPDGSMGVAFDGGTKIFGGWSRSMDQRSLSIFARNQYGVDQINYPLFPDRNYDVFQALVLRNSGNDWINTMMRDGTLTGLMEGSGLDFQAYRPAVTYLNGQYWGFYNMREKVNEHFLASKHKLKPDEINLLHFAGEAVHGDNQDYVKVIDFVKVNSLVDDNNYQVVIDEIDIGNFITYVVAQLFFDNQDWPGNNIKFWKPDGGKWKWILFDTDFGFGIWNEFAYQNNTIAFALESDGPGWPNPPWSTLLFRKLIQNTTFRNALVNRFADEMNSRFLYDRIEQQIDENALRISSEVLAHYDRWGEAPSTWSSQVANMRNFAAKRPEWVKLHIREEFDLPATHRLSIQNEDSTQGHVQVNSLTIKDESWSGDYFEAVPIKITAKPALGYTFSHWTGADVPNNPEIEVDMKSAMSLTPHFEGNAIDEIVINEINYNSSDDLDTGDWIELFNPNEAAMDLSNWVLKDNDDSHEFILPEGTNIAGKGYLILTKNTADFQEIYPDIPVLGDFDFGLSSDEDAVRLFDSEMNLRDEVHYQATAPWPLAANGEGATLELKKPDLDNSLAENWSSFHDFGSPNKINNDINNIFTERLIQNLLYYPNPFTDEINITFSLQKTTKIKVSLYRMDGSLVHSIFEGKLGFGKHQLEANIDFLSKGVYLLQIIEENGATITSKWVKM